MPMTPTTRYAIVDLFGKPWGIGDTPQEAWCNSVEWLDPRTDRVVLIDEALVVGEFPSEDLLQLWCREVDAAQLESWGKQGFHVG